MFYIRFGKLAGWQWRGELELSYHWLCLAMVAMDGGGVVIYLYQKRQIALTCFLSTVGALHVSVWLLHLFVKYLKKSLEKSVQYNRDQGFGRSS